MSAERPTLDAVARAAGVSRMSVSNAYNRPDQLSPATRAAILATARELGYPGPDPAGRSLRRGRTGTVGVLITEQLSYAFSDPGLVALLRGLSTVIGAAGQAMLLIPVEADPEHAPVRSALVDAFVLCSLAPNGPAVADVLARRLPVVTAGGLRLPGIPHVGVDNARAAARMAEHLAGLGHTRFGVISFGAVPEPLPAALADEAPADEPYEAYAPEASAAEPSAAEPSAAPEPAADLPGTYWTMQQRVRGFVRACGREPVLVTAVRNDRQAGARAARRLLADPARRPTAVFAVTDVLALGVLDAAAELGLAVPADLSVAGFDGVPAGQASRPALTTISIGLFEQGVRAGRMVLELIAGRPVSGTRFRTELVVRSSTAAPRPRRGTPRPARRP